MAPCSSTRVVIDWDMFEQRKNDAETYDARIQVRKEISESRGHLGEAS